MDYSKKRAPKFKLFSLVFLAALSPNLSAAKDMIGIQIYNCSDSHHEVRVQSYKDGDPLGTGSSSDDHLSIHSGETKAIYCYQTDKCALVFKSGGETAYETTKHSPWYVHVKKSHKISISETESKVCGSS